MKELTTEEKAKAYDEALERAKKYLGDCMLTRQEYVEKVFPELKESEDEKIRKNIIDFLQETIDNVGEAPNTWTMNNVKKWITWLKKQSKQKSNDKVDNNYHPWNIKDAKDGDILAYESGWTCIFKHIHGIWYSSYCFITANGEFHTGYEDHEVDSTINGNVHPATKEQRDLLFQKMREAGYTFDFEKKELKSID